MIGRTTTVAAMSALALVATTGVATAADKPESPPVVTIKLDDGDPKIAGSQKLSAGWVTFKVSAKKNQHNLWLYVPKPGAKDTDADRAGQEVGAARAGAKPGEAAEGKAAKKSAADAAGAEDTLIALGGVYVAPKRPGVMSVLLPQGQVTIADLAAGGEKATTPLTVLKVGTPGKAVRTAGNAARVSIDDTSRIQSPATLPRKGELRISNMAQSRWHFIGVQKLKKKMGEKEVTAFFASGGKTPSPFDRANSTAAAPMSGGREQYLRYDLPAGKYAIVDAWVDSATGKFYAAQGAVRLVTLK